MELFGSGSRSLKQSLRSPSGFLMAVVGLTAGSLLVALTVEPGPGLGAYLPWADALVQGIPDPLVSNTRTLSPTGFPLLHWYPGTGLFLAVPTLLSAGSVSVEHSAPLAGSVAIVLTLAVSASLLYRIAGNQVGLLLFGMSLLLVATNTGYYIGLLGSEFFAFGLVAVLTWLAWCPKDIGAAELAGLGALTSLLVTVRPQVVMMAVPPLVLGLLRWAGRRPRQRLIRTALALAAPLALGVLIVLQLNHWMTGEWTGSPSLWGNEVFRPNDLYGRYFWLVLFDSRAGALRHTPFIALGLCASLVPITDRRLDKPHRAFYLVSLLVSLALIWMISGFYAWSGGLLGFGSRYLNLLSLYGVMAVMHVLASERVGWALRAAFGGLSLACATYSAALLFPRLPLLVSFALGTTTAAWLAIRRKEYHRRIPDASYGCLGLSLLVPLVAYYVWKMTVAHTAFVRPNGALVSTHAAVVIIVIVVYCLSRTFPNSIIPARSVAILALATLVVTFSLLVRLGVGAAAFQARELASPSSHFLYRSRVGLANLESDLKSPEAVYKWPADVRRSIEIYLEEEKRRTAIRR